MGKEKLKKLIVSDPISGEPLHISELACEESGVTIRAKFEIPRYARLDAEQERFRYAAIVQPAPASNSGNCISRLLGPPVLRL